MPQKNNDSAPVFDPGKEICVWTAHDYHPHDRGWKWIAVFCTVFFGSAIWALAYGDWVMAFTLFVAVAVYFYVHRNGNEDHQVQVLTKALVVDGRLYPLEQFSGYWFVYDSTASLIKFQFNDGRRDRKITLQMGENTPDFFRKSFASTDFKELEDKKESLLELWVRALKL